MRRIALLCPLLLLPLAGCQDPAEPVAPAEPPSMQAASVPDLQPGSFLVIKARGYSWTEAAIMAANMTVKKQSYVSHLATPATIQEAFAVFAVMKQGQQCWIGAAQYHTATTPAEDWRWVDGSPWSYAAFTDGDPDDGDGIENAEETVAAAHLFRSGNGWHDLPLSTRLDCFVVEIEAII